LEAYIYVPTERSGQVRQGIAVELMDNTGKLLEKTKIDFLSPQVTALAGNSGKGFGPCTPEVLRNAQMIKARSSGAPLHGRGAGAGGYAPGRAELRVCCPAAERHFVAHQVASRWAIRWAQLFSLLGPERGRPVIVSSTQFLINTCRLCLAGSLEYS